MQVERGAVSPDGECLKHAETDSARAKAIKILLCAGLFLTRALWQHYKILDISTHLGIRPVLPDDVEKTLYILPLSGSSMLAIRFSPFFLRQRQKDVWTVSPVWAGIFFFNSSSVCLHHNCWSINIISVTWLSFCKDRKKTLNYHLKSKRRQFEHNIVIDLLWNPSLQKKHNTVISVHWFVSSTHSGRVVIVCVHLDRLQRERVINLTSHLNVMTETDTEFSSTGNER